MANFSCNIFLGSLVKKDQFGIFILQSDKIGSEESLKEIFSFLVETMETAVKSWHETSKVDPRVYFLLDKEKTQTDKYAPVVNIDKVLARALKDSKLCNVLGFCICLLWFVYQRISWWV